MTPPLLVVNKLVTDFLDKGNLFNNLCAKRCSPISNNSTVSVNINFESREKLLSLGFFFFDVVVKIVKSLGKNKVYYHDKTSIRMIKLPVPPQ